MVMMIEVLVETDTDVVLGGGVVDGVDVWDSDVDVEVLEVVVGGVEVGFVLEDDGGVDELDGGLLVVELVVEASGEAPVPLARCRLTRSWACLASTMASTRTA